MRVGTLSDRQDTECHLIDYPNMNGYMGRVCVGADGLVSVVNRGVLPPRGGGHCLFEGRYPKQNYGPPVLCYHSPLSLSLLVYSPLFSRYQRTAYCYYCCYRDLPPVDIIFSCPNTITLITVAKTLIIANLGCFPWTSQANNYSPNRKCPSDSLPSESFWVCDSLLLQAQPTGTAPGVRFAVGTHNQGSAPPPPPGFYHSTSE